jgi:hypothetical protein
MSPSFGDVGDSKPRGSKKERPPRFEEAVRQVGQMNRQTLFNELYLYPAPSIAELLVPSIMIMVAVSARVIVAVEPAMIVPLVEPTVDPAVVIAIVVTVSATVVAVAHATHVVPISRHPVPAVIVPIDPRISRTGARRNVGFISDPYCDSQLGCIRSVRTERQTAG